jgi:HPt (histidine-containing phosphotransfer) domain-containing protein
MQNPLVTKELLSAIRELSQKLEDKLKENKYYVALKKIDEMLHTIKALGDQEADVNLSSQVSPGEKSKSVVAERTTADITH